VALHSLLAFWGFEISVVFAREFCLLLALAFGFRFAIG
jgi:hypothetical protein